jgi:glucarate dehydratase
MHFLISATDFTDDDAAARRAASRPQHLRGLKEMSARGEFLTGGAVGGADGRVRGSSAIVRFDDEADVSAWLENEPYVTDRVWEQVDVSPIALFDVSVASRSVVTAVRVTPILIADGPLLNMQGVHQPYTPRSIVEVETCDGTVGLGESYGDDEYLQVFSAFAEHLIGESVLSPNRLWALAERFVTAESSPPKLVDDLPSRNVFGDNSLYKLRATVVSFFEVAFLDASGHLLGVPVHALLGGKVRDQIDFAAYLFYRWDEHPGGGGPPDEWPEALDPAGIVAQAHRMIELHGFRSLKLKGGVFPPDDEIAAIRALHEAFPQLPLRLDPNGVWSEETSIRVAHELDGLIEYLEDPCIGQAPMGRVHDATGMPLATNMCVTRPDEIGEAVRLGSVQVLLADHHYWGGLRATQKLSTVCAILGISLSMHSNSHLGISLAAMVHAAACADGNLHACDTHRPWQTDDVITEPHSFSNGAITVPDAPGLGVTLDREKLAELHQRWLRSDVRRRDDVAAMQVRYPGFTKPPVPRW